MTKPARNAAQIDRVREDIIASAVELITAGGFAGMTMRKLAASMNMSATNLYNYFRNKDEIYITILIRGFKDLYERMRAARDRDPDPVAGVRALVTEYLSFGIENFNYYDIMFSAGLPKYNDYVGTPFEELSRIEMDYSRKIIDLTLEVISGLIEAFPGVGPDIAERRFLEIWSMLHGMISLKNSTLAAYVVANPLEVYDNIVEDIIRFGITGKNS
jgi:AcrR family transcriptional regulator